MAVPRTRGCAWLVAKLDHSGTLSIGCDKTRSPCARDRTRAGEDRSGIDRDHRRFGGGALDATALARALSGLVEAGTSTSGVVSRFRRPARCWPAAAAGL